MFKFKNISIAPEAYQGNGTIISFWQEQIFTYTFFALSLLGILPYLYKFYQARLFNQWHFFLFYSLLYAVLIIVASCRRIPFRFRVWPGVAVFYLLGALSLFSSGFTGSAMLFFICFSVMGVIFGRIRIGMITLGINFLTLLISGKYQIILPHLLDNSSGILSDAAGQNGYEAMGAFFFINTILTIALGSFIKAVESSGNEFKLIVNNTSDLIWSLDKDSKITYVSPASESILGYRQKELTGRHMYNFFAGETKDDFLKALQKNSFCYQTIIRHRDQTLLHVEISGFRTGDRQENSNYYQGTIKNISQIKALEEEHQRLKDSLAKSDRLSAIGSLSRKITHDLNSILSGIATYPDVLLMDNVLDEKTRRGLMMIKETGQSAADIVRDFVTISSGITAEKQPTDLNHLIEGLLKSEEYERIISEFPKIPLDVQLDPELLSINAAYAHIEKTLMNLLRFSYSQLEKAGYGQVVIITSNTYISKTNDGEKTVPPGEYTLLRIQSIGTGLAKQYAENLFEPFFIKKVMEKEGTGLELAVAWNTVQDHQGTIHVVTDPSEICFDLVFPSIRKPIDLDTLCIGEIKGAKENILVVDSNQDQGKIACEILETLGYTAWSAAHGPDVITCMKQKGIHVIILDMTVTDGMDGIEMIRLIKKTDAGQKIIPAGLGILDSKESKIVRKMGSKNFVKKPYTILDLGIAIKEELEK